MRIVCLTSNDYHHALPGFAWCFNNYWPNQRVEVLCYDAPLPDLPPNFTATRLGNQSDFTWSSGLLKYLDTFPEHQLVLMLDDYWLSEPVRQPVYFSLIPLLHTYQDIDKIDLTDDRMNHPHDIDAMRDWIISNHDAPYQTSIQAAIWRTTFLKRFLAPSETPWEFEKKGTLRLIAAREAGTYTGKIIGMEEPVVRYVNAIGGGQGAEYHIFAKKRFDKGMWSQLKMRGFVSEGQFKHG